MENKIKKFEQVKMAEIKENAKMLLGLSTYLRMVAEDIIEYDNLPEMLDESSILKHNIINEIDSIVWAMDEIAKEHDYLIIELENELFRKHNGAIIKEEIENYYK